MPKYVALMRGTGEGCDWTIACNKDYLIFEADNRDKAEEKCFSVYESHGGKKGDPAICEIMLFEVTGEKAVDLISYNRKIEEEENNKKQREKEEYEREQYERLKKKFEDK